MSVIYSSNGNFYINKDEAFSSNTTNEMSSKNGTSNSVIILLSIILAINIIFIAIYVIKGENKQIRAKSSDNDDEDSDVIDKIL